MYFGNASLALLSLTEIQKLEGECARCFGGSLVRGRTVLRRGNRRCPLRFCPASCRTRKVQRAHPSQSASTRARQTAAGGTPSLGSGYRSETAPPNSPGP